MKRATLILAALIFIIACKDKKKSDPQPAQPVVEAKKQVSVKINGSVFDCTTCGNTSKSGNLTGINFREGTNNRFVFFVTGFLKPGNYNIASASDVSFTYEKDGTYYPGKGSLTLSEADTSANGALKKFIGTFNCKTDTVNGKSFEFSEGILNINFN